MFSLRSLLAIFERIYNLKNKMGTSNMQCCFCEFNNASFVRPFYTDEVRKFINYNYVYLSVYIFSQLLAFIIIIMSPKYFTAEKMLRLCHATPVSDFYVGD